MQNKLLCPSLRLITWAALAQSAPHGRPWILPHPTKGNQEVAPFGECWRLAGWLLSPRPFLGAYGWLRAPSLSVIVVWLLPPFVCRFVATSPFPHPVIVAGHLFKCLPCRCSTCAARRAVLQSTRPLGRRSCNEWWIPGRQHGLLRAAGGRARASPPSGQCRSWSTIRRQAPVTS